MSFGLKRRILAAADVPHEGGLLTDGAVFLNSKYGDAAAAEVGKHQVMTVFIY